MYMTEYYLVKLSFQNMCFYISAFNISVKWIPKTIQNFRIRSLKTFMGIYITLDIVIEYLWINHSKDWGEGY